jgi:hypothetical protein
MSVGDRCRATEGDRTYCVLMIFDLRTPLLYGERLPAALRHLQIEILQMQDDTGIFAWHAPPPEKPQP